MKKKLVIVSLAAFFLFLFNAGNVYCKEEVPAFRDIKGSFAEQAIIHLTGQGIIHGINVEQFAPGKNVSRLQFAILIAKTLGVQPYFPPEPTFSDVSPGTVEAGYIEALANLGLISGTGGKTFDGDNPVRRQDAAVIIRKAMEEETQVLSIKGKYADADRIYPYAVESVAYVTDKGWMNGSGGYFYPLKYLTRAEAAVLIARLLKTRQDQALKALQQPVEQLDIRTKASWEIGTHATKYPITFTSVYGTDNPAICNVTQDGNLVSGNETGVSTITVNAGTNSFPVTVKVNDTGRGLPLNNSLTPSGETELELTYQVVEQSPDTVFKNTEYKSYPGPVDGLPSKSESWTGFLRQQGRDIVVNLKTTNTVSGISMEFRQDANSGVCLPKYIMGSVSMDGVSWYQLGHVYHGVDPSDKKVQTRTLALTFPPVTARYIKLSFPVDTWVFARRLMVKGGSPAEKPVILAPIIRDISSTETYLQDPAIKDILLVYTGDKSEQQTFTGDDFLPLVAYLNRQGEIKGRMFDTMLFLPFTGLPCTSRGWDSYVEDLFAPGYQLQALEDTLAKINEATGGQEKEKVILTVPYPDSNQLDFNGKSLSFSEKNGGREKAAKNRFEAVQGIYDKLLDKWNGAGFKNLELAGIYWNKESVNQTIYGEAELVQKVAQMVRGNDQDFFWIPYYGAPGYGDWKSFGFTHVFLQPNYYATQAPSEDRMDRAADLARQYTTGIEIECDNRIIGNLYYYDLFYKELKKAHQLGLDRDTVNAYHVGLKRTLLVTVYSDVPEYRGIYDDLYRWISGSYK